MAANGWEGFWQSLSNWFQGHGWQDYDSYNPNNPADMDPLGMSSGSGGGSAASGFGNALNNITGVTASQQWQHDEANLERDWQHAERLDTQAYNSAEAQKARDWQKMMDDTAVTRRMEDIVGAGLNPMAMVSGGSMLTGIGSSGSTAASSSSGAGASAGGAGNSAAAVGSAIKSFGSVVSAIIKALK